MTKFLRIGGSSSRLITSAACLGILFVTVAGQEPTQNPETPTETLRKANVRPADIQPDNPEPFDGASVEVMAERCVTLETEVGTIEIEMLPQSAPESVRSFLNLVSTGALDTTTFSRTVKNFVIQGGNLATSERWRPELAKRMGRKLPDEPSLIRHVRGVVSMARPEEPNSATTHFFILVGDGHHLDGKFAAFGRVINGIEVVDVINQAPADGEKPGKAVRITRGMVSTCKQ